MISYPKLRRHLSIQAIRSDLSVILSDVEHWTFRGPVFPRLLPLLDGSRSVPEIVEELCDCANVAEVRAALLILEESGYLAEEERARQIRQISVVSLVPSMLDVTVQTVEALDVCVQPGSGLTLVITDEYLRRELADFAASTERAWIPVKPTGAHAWIGPVVSPPKTPCWKCLRERVRANRPAHEWLHSRQAPPVSEATEGPMLRVLILAVQAALELGLQAADRRKSQTRSTLVTMDPNTLRSEKHVVVRQPGCPRCGGQAQGRSLAKGARNGSVELQCRSRFGTADGGWRAVPPVKTFRQYRHHISPITGVVSRFERRRVSSRSLELYTAEHIFLSSPGDPFHMGRRASAGKGMSRTQARTSALCEALERYSGIFRGDEDRMRASYASLGDAAIYPNACTNFSDAQFDQRHVWNAQSSPRTWVPRRLDPAEEIEWTPVWSLTRGTFRYVPTAYCYYGYRLEATDGYCRADSNGCAAGNNLEEAILQGFLELVERDAVALWWYNELTKAAVDLDAFSNTFFHASLEDCKRAGRSLQVLDLTTDLAIPAFAAISEDIDAPGTGLLIGFGAHLDAEVAIGRALTELGQWQSGVALGVAGPCFSNAAVPPGDFLRRAPPPVIRTRQDFRSVDHNDIRNAVDSCVVRAAQCGLETLVLDQTREDVGLPTVRVIVPGMRHFWPRFGPGRLYQVPVDQGWLPVANEEHRLNKVHILI